MKITEEEIRNKSIRGLYLEQEIQGLEGMVTYFDLDEKITKTIDIQPICGVIGIAVENGKLKKYDFFEVKYAGNIADFGTYFVKIKGRVYNDF